MELSKYQKVGMFSCLLLIVVFIIFYIMGGKKTMKPLYINEIAINSVELSDTSLCIKGYMLSSGKSFRKSTYEIENETLYISIYGGLVNEKSPSGDFCIDLQDNFTSVTTIYLKGMDGNKLLYP